MILSYIKRWKCEKKMSSKLLNKKFEDIVEEEPVKKPFDLKEFVIPFSEFGKSVKYIYFGFEKIPFKERHPVYQRILMNEFARTIKQFHNSLRI